MKLTLESGTANQIRAYGPGAVTINESVVTRSVIVTPTRVIADWPPQQFEELDAGHLATLAELEAEIVLLGTGERLRFPQAALMRELMERGIGVEVMDTAAACRTYNVLMSEGRLVAAALLMI